MQTASDQIAEQLLAVNDLGFWLAGLNDGVDFSMQRFPIPGALLSTALSDMFALAKDNAGIMLVAPDSECRWLAALPIDRVMTHAQSGRLIIVTLPSEPIPRTNLPAMSLQLELAPSVRDQLAGSVSIGFGLFLDDVKLERVNRIVELQHI
jgi:hypothetical protein